MAELGDGLQFGNKEQGEIVNQYPVLTSATSGLLTRCEPMLTPKLLKSRFLKKVDTSDYSSEELKDEIKRAMNKAEMALGGITITREKYRNKVPFDQNLYQKFIHIMVEKGKPICSLEFLGIRSSNQIDIFKIPPTWIESARFYQGQINVVPLTVVGATSISSGNPTGAAGLAFIAAMNGGISWVPAYWEIEYTSGLANAEGQFPIIVNELIGTIAAIEILSNLGPAIKATSASVSHDGISQSSSGLGPAQYKQRMDELKEEKIELVNKIKGIFNLKYFVSNI